jgi:hypothetical protein
MKFLLHRKKKNALNSTTETAFSAMSQAAIWKIMRAYGIPDVDLLESLYAHSTVTRHGQDGTEP